MNPDFSKGLVPAVVQNAETGKVLMVAYMDEPLSAVVYRMAKTGLTRFPVVERGDHRFVGMVSLSDLLQGRKRTLDAEHRRERVRGFGWGASPGESDETS